MADAAQWSVQHLQARGPLQRFRPRRLSDLYVGATLSPLPIDQEVIWASEIVLQNIGHIRTYLDYRGRIEQALVADEGERALVLLDEMDGSVGYSLVGVAVRIPLLQLYRGLEAQKDFLAKLRERRASPNVRFFAHWWSVRSEDSSSRSNFNKDFSSRLKRWSIEESFRSHIAFEILGDMPVAGEEASFLSGAYLASAIDVFEAILALMSTSIVEGRDALNELLPLLRRIHVLAPSPRTTKLLFLAGEQVGLATLSSPSLLWRNTTVAAHNARPSQAPISLEEIRAASVSGFEFASSTPFSSRLAEAFIQEAEPEQMIRTQAGLTKLALMFDHLGAGQWLGAIANDTHVLSSAVSDMAAKYRFLATPNLEPEVLRRLSPELRAELSAALPTPGIHPYIDWHLTLSNRTRPDDNKHLGKIPKVELRLLNAFSNEDHASLIELANEFYREAGGHSHLSLNALVHGELGLKGVEEASVLAVEQLLSNPAIAAWLPIDDLASRILRADVADNLIDIPILLHFAAMQKLDPYASERTYAVEDFLASLGAMRPTDLMGRIERCKASDREVFFFQECCTVSSLRISTLFQNETELEEERIAICQWLNQEKSEDFDRLEEEAVELVRGRLVRQGLRELEGSKLSVDSVGLRAWADRTLREDYNRYIDLLESGLFVVDEAFKEAVFDAIESERVDQPDLIIPENEGAALLATILTRAIREYALHSEHGLDAYLSLRIRHGTISGQLRGPIEEQNLITRRRTDQSYLANEYWIERLGGSLPPVLINAIDMRLSKLSRSYDSLIERLTKDLVQIRSKEKPDGLIRIDVHSTLVAITMAETTPEVSFDDFMTRCEDIFWAIVSAGSGFVSAAIDELGAETHEMFDSAEEDMRAMAEEATAPIRDALLRGKGTAFNQLEKIREWLQPPTTTASLTLDIEALVRVSLSVIQGFYKTFQPKLSIKSPVDLQLTNAVRWFSDVFFILFENVLKYSGNATDPEVEIVVEEGADYLLFTVKNSIDAISNDQIARVEKARQRISDGSFRTAVRSEGGTGLPKLAKVIAYGNGGELDFRLDEPNSKFEVIFKVRKLTLAGGEG